MSFINKKSETGLGTAPCAVTQTKPGAVDQSEMPPKQPLWIIAHRPELPPRSLLWNPGLRQKSLPSTLEGLTGSANLAAVLQVWQTRDFSSALCSVKLKMCLARKPSLIFKPLCVFFSHINLIHMFLIYLYLTHQVKLGATMMNGDNVNFQEDF